MFKGRNSKPYYLESVYNLPSQSESSFRRKSESSPFKTFWMPDQVRHDKKGHLWTDTTSEIFGSIVEKSKLSFEFYILDLLALLSTG
jgi:hypothetical protein